jgi:hypothetical protein
MSDGGPARNRFAAAMRAWRSRPLLALEVWKSSQKWSTQRSGVGSIAWLDALVRLWLIMPLTEPDLLLVAQRKKVVCGSIEWIVRRMVEKRVVDDANSVWQRGDIASQAIDRGENVSVEKCDVLRSVLCPRELQDMSLRTWRR